MSTTKNRDIIIRKNEGVQMPWLNQDYLLRLLLTLSEDYLRKRCRPLFIQTGQGWEWEKINGSFYYRYEGIPNKAPTYYRNQLPTRYELIDMANDPVQEAPAELIADVFAEYLNTHFTNYLHLYGNCNEKQQESLSKAAALIQGCIDHVTNNKIDVRKKDFWIEAATYFQQQDLKYIPHNFRCLKDKVIAVMTGDQISDVIKLPRAGNDNRSLFNDQEVRSWVLTLRGMGKNFTNSYIIRKIQYACAVTGKPVPSERWIGSIMEEPNTNYLTALGRFGDNGRLAVMHKTYVPIKNALFAGDCWQMDGTRVNLIDHKHTYADGTKGMAYLYIVCIRDVHSGDILGYSYSLAEDRWMYLNALKMAVKETGYLPYQLVRDRFPGHDTEEYQNFETDIKNRGVKVTETSKATGKAQIERFFLTWQDCFMQDSDYYYGLGIKSRRKSAHRSEEYLKQMKAKARKEKFDFDGACDETDILLEAYRTTELCKYSRKHKQVEKSPKQLHADSEKPHVIEISSHQFTYLFGLKKELQIKRGGMITTEIQKYPFMYRCTDHNVISQYDKVLIVYQLEDLSTIHLYEISDKAVKKYLGTANEIDAPQLYGPNAEFDKLNREQAIIREINLQREQEYSLKMASGSDIVSFLSPNSTPKHQYNMIEDNILNNYSDKVGSNTAVTDEPTIPDANDEILSQL
jgi:hypothetical protein